MTETLSRLLEAARQITPTEADRQAQRISFAYGNAHIENENITREMVCREAQTQEGSPPAAGLLGEGV